MPTVTTTPMTSQEVLRRYVDCIVLQCMDVMSTDPLLMGPIAITMQADWGDAEHTVEVPTTGRKKHELIPPDGDERKRKTVCWAVYDDYLAAAEDLKAWRATQSKPAEEPDDVELTFVPAAKLSKRKRA